MKINKLLKINLIIAFLMSTMGIIMMSSEINSNGNLYELVQIIKNFIILFMIFFLGLNITCLPIYIIKSLLFTKTVVNEQYIDTKKSIYTRELPEEYNCVIAGELLDFKSSFKEEYAAGVIELISKGYIIESEEKLFVDNKKSTDTLLKNEKYILETCTKGLIYNYEFFKKIREDMMDLGLYKEEKILKKIKDRINYILKQCEENEAMFFGILGSLYIVFIAIVLSFAFNFKLMFFISILLYLIIVIVIRKNKLTKKGEIEKEKIGKLKLFFERETNFRDKTKEERKIWGRYSAYAVALGTNEKIKEEIFKKIFY